MFPLQRPLQRSITVLVLLAAALSFCGCAVVTVAGTAASLAVTGVGLAADATVGAVRLTGKAVGAAADAVMPSSAP
jgi:hypothetical protein